ncbi:MAG: hypothetical protein ACRD22_14030 [Terriglobia bacterium]
MRRWVFAIVLLGLMFCAACGLVSQFSAVVEGIAFWLVPPVFLVASIAGLSMHKLV